MKLLTSINKKKFFMPNRSSTKIKRTKNIPLPIVNANENYSNDLFIIKKNEKALTFLKKHGLPKKVIK